MFLDNISFFRSLPSVIFRMKRCLETVINNEFDEDGKRRLKPKTVSRFCCDVF